MSDVQYKQYIIVIKPLADKVSKAKFGVHCAHSCLVAVLNHTDSERFKIWYNSGHLQVKIIKEVQTLQKLENIIYRAKEEGFFCAMISDAGFSEEMNKGDYIMGTVGPITEKEAFNLGIFKLSNYKK